MIVPAIIICILSSAAFILMFTCEEYPKINISIAMVLLLIIGMLSVTLIGMLCDNQREIKTYQTILVKNDLATWETMEVVKERTFKLKVKGEK